MNYVGHVAAAVHDEAADDDLLLGAALPDLLPSGALVVERLAPSVRRGVEHHRRADAVFHADPRFVELMSSLRASLRDDAVTRGPARAAAHAGVELTMDGVLLGDPEVSAAFARVWGRLAAPDDVVAGVVAAADRDRWLAWLARLTTELDPWSHAGPHAVARRLERLLARRPRLAMRPGEVDVVARHLADRHHDIAAATPLLLAGVCAGAARA